LAELTKCGTKRVLEVGAGIGLTTERMLRSGFEVTSLEPNRILRGVFKDRLGFDAHATSFETFDDREGAYDALISESVLYALDLRSSFGKAHRLIRPGGLFAFAEMLWTEVANADVVSFIHDQTTRTFGIAMAPRGAVTWHAWRESLFDAGFRQVIDIKVEPGEERQDAQGRTKAGIALLMALLRRPWMVPQYVAYQAYGRLSWAPPTWLESRVGVWRRN
jgi:SAM-dependent methyltransferase